MHNRTPARMRTRRKDEPMKKLGSPEFDDKNHSEVTKSSSREKEKFQDEIQHA